MGFDIATPFDKNSIFWNDITPLTCDLAVISRSLQKDFFKFFHFLHRNCLKLVQSKCQRFGNGWLFKKNTIQ